MTQYPTQNPPSPGGMLPPRLSDADQRLWATLAHLGSILFSFVAPLIIFLVYRDRGGFVRRQSAEALNFQITLAIAHAVSALLWVVAVGIIGTVVVAVAGLVLPILAAVAVGRGEEYRYPLSLRLFR